MTTSSLTPEVIRARYRAHYGATGTTVIVIGDVDAAVLADFRKRLAAAPETKGEPAVAVASASRACPPTRSSMEFRILTSSSS